MTSSHNQSRFLSAEERQQFEAAEPPELKHADIWMISGCEDRQTSADVSNVHSFQLPDPAGRAGGACTATLLSVLYENEKNPCKEYTFADVIERMRQQLQKKGFHQVPQLTSTRPISLGDTPFKIVPDAYQEFPGATKRAVLIGINYRGHKKGELRGCHNDAFNMYNYIQDFYGFQDQDVTVLADDGDHPLPTKAAILQAYRHVVAISRPGDSIFLHYSGHGTKVKDQNGDEDDGYDEAMMPIDYDTAGVILDDDLYDIFVKGLKPGVHVVALFDCCHSGTLLDLPYIFKANGEYSRMEIDRGSHQFNKLAGKFGLKSLFGKANWNKINKLSGGKINKLGGGKLVNGFINQIFK